MKRYQLVEKSTNKGQSRVLQVKSVKNRYLFSQYDCLAFPLGYYIDFMVKKGLVEMVAGDDEQSFNQKCKYGNLVEGHSVYCHNESPEAPRKCRHTWYYGKDKKGCQDEDCPLFEANPNYR